MGATESSLLIESNKDNMTPEKKEKMFESLLKKCDEILKEHPDNRCVKYVVDYMNNGEGKSLSVEGELHVFFSYFDRYSMIHSLNQTFSFFLAHPNECYTSLQMARSSGNASRLVSRTQTLALVAMP